MGYDFVYGLPELNKEAIQNAQAIANPGCFATAIQLALLPLAAEGLLKNSVHINAVTGATGAGVGGGVVTGPPGPPVLGALVGAMVSFIGTMVMLVMLVMFIVLVMFTKGTIVKFTIINNKTNNKSDYQNGNQSIDTVTTNSAYHQSHCRSA